MIVYHGSLEKIKQPEIREPNRNLDYGGGFYATTSEAQSTDWVRRRMTEKQAKEGFVNEYIYRPNRRMARFCYEEPHRQAFHSQLRCGLRSCGKRSCVCGFRSI